MYHVLAGGKITLETSLVWDRVQAFKILRQELNYSMNPTGIAV